MVATSASISTNVNPSFGGIVGEYLWNWQGQTLRIIYETIGQGTPVLLRPAFSTVSSRSEMGEIAKRLASQFQQAVALDWPGFGESERPPFDYKPALYHQFLQDFVTTVFNTPVAVIAAGHAAGYAMQLAQKQPHVFSHIVLVAPTWRGPLRVMGLNEQITGMVRELVRSPIAGQALYKLNTAPSFLKFMYRRHVFTNPARLTPDFIQDKWQMTQQPGARFAPAAFVTGTLDPVNSRDEFLARFQPLPVPVMVIISEQAPPYSKTEMEALVDLPGVQTRRLPGSLGMHEEYPEAVTDAILPFLHS